MEMLRRFMISAPTTFREKWDTFFENFWNALTTFAVCGFLIGFGFRLMPNISISSNLPMATLSSYTVSIKRDIGRIILALDSVPWVIKMLDYLSIHPKFGPYIYAAGKMVLNSIYVIILLSISLLAFGLPRQSISFPNEEWHWLLIRNIFYKPYFMVYGEVYADEIDLCDDEAWEGHLGNGIPLNEFNKTNTIHCVPGYWIPPILMTIFLIVATFLLLSMLIATFNQIFDRVRRTAHQIWLFQRYNQVIQYECTPCIPPPFTPIYYFYALIKYIWRRYNSCDRGSKRLDEKNKHDDKHTMFDWSLKLYLSKEQIETLHDFEEECMEELFKNKDKSKSIEERIKISSAKTDIMYTKLNNIEGEEMNVNSRLNELEDKIKDVNEKQTIIINYLQKLTENQDIIKQRPHDFEFLGNEGTRRTSRNRSNEEAIIINEDSTSEISPGMSSEIGSNVFINNEDDE
uniref:Ion transport domain-containing protein n=1 Tax=Acrobeloides nanus TaxID=290746 RepID=A0A914C0Q2_9BILA